MPIRLASQACSLEYKFIIKEEADEKTSQKENSLTETFWAYDFYITALSSLPAPMVIRKTIMVTTSHALDLMK